MHGVESTEVSVNPAKLDLDSRSSKHFTRRTALKRVMARQEPSSCSSNHSCLSKNAGAIKRMHFNVHVAMFFIAIQPLQRK
jgi:hypothetical protein